MAASNCCGRLINRIPISSLRSALKSRKIQTPRLSPTRPSSSLPSTRFSSFSRAPVELGCSQSLLPLHSATAVARLTSCLTSNSRNCRALSQGT